MSHVETPVHFPFVVTSTPDFLPTSVIVYGTSSVPWLTTAVPSTTSPGPAFNGKVAMILLVYSLDSPQVHSWESCRFTSNRPLVMKGTPAVNRRTEVKARSHVAGQFTHR